MSTLQILGLSLLALFLVLLCAWVWCISKPDHFGDFRYRGRK